MMTERDFWIRDTGNPQVACPHGNPTLAIVSALDQAGNLLEEKFDQTTNQESIPLCPVEQALQFMEHVASCGWEIGNKAMMTSCWVLPHEIRNLSMHYYTKETASVPSS